MKSLDYYAHMRCLVSHGIGFTYDIDLALEEDEHAIGHQDILNLTYEHWGIKYILPNVFKLLWYDFMVLIAKYKEDK